MIKVYLKMIALLAFITVVFGGVCPALISAASTELVILGFVVFFVIGIPGIFYIGKSALKDYNHICDVIMKKDLT